MVNRLTGDIKKLSGSVNFFSQNKYKCVKVSYFRIIFLLLFWSFRFVLFLFLFFVLLAVCFLFAWQVFVSIALFLRLFFQWFYWRCCYCLQCKIFFFIYSFFIYDSGANFNDLLMRLLGWKLWNCRWRPLMLQFRHICKRLFLLDNWNLKEFCS